VTVTAEPLCDSTPFHRDEIVWPLANVQVNVQLVQAVVLVLLIVRAAPKEVEF
jgi:hypothetical protein